MLEDAIEKIINNTELYVKNCNKEIRKRYCQFFTHSDIANYMCSMFSQNFAKSVRILDPCGGTGILEAYILKHLINNKKADKIVIDIYEIDEYVLSTLKKNIILLKNEIKGICNFKVNIINDNFITNNESKWNENVTGIYDYIIGNPPYKKIGKDDEEAKIMQEVVYGQPNLYMLFLAMSISLLKDTGELIFLIPRSFCNGRYFKRFRKWMGDNCYISNIHSFEDRNKIINDEVLQELIILKLDKIIKKDVVLGHSKSNLDIYNSIVEIVDYRTIWEQTEMNRIRLPLLNGDSKLLERFDKLPTTFQREGIIFSTGQVVDFRVKEGLINVPCNGAVPLIWSAHFGNNTINWPIPNKKLQQYIIERVNTKIIQPASNFILVKRFSSKEEDSIKVNLLFKRDISTAHIGIENHVNYARFEENNLSLLLAIYTLLKSGIYNRYFKIINGTTQINVSDLNTLPCFKYNTLIELGKNLEKEHIDELTSNICDKIIYKYISFE